jgi:hypothetical protein
VSFRLYCPFNVTSHSAFITFRPFLRSSLFPIRYYSIVCPIRRLLLLTFCSFLLISYSILSHFSFYLSTFFCPIQRWHSTFRWLFFIRRFVDASFIDLPSLRSLQNVVILYHNKIGMGTCKLSFLGLKKNPESVKKGRSRWRQILFFGMLAPCVPISRRLTVVICRVQPPYCQHTLYGVLGPCILSLIFR